MAYGCYWLAMSIHRYLEQLWTLKLEAFMIQYIYKVCATCVNMSCLLVQNYILMTVIVVFLASVAGVLMLLHLQNTPTFTLIYRRNIFLTHLKDLFPSSLVPSFERPVLKTSSRAYKVSMRRIDTMMFGELIRYVQPGSNIKKAYNLVSNMIFGILRVTFIISTFLF